VPSAFKYGVISSWTSWTTRKGGGGSQCDTWQKSPDQLCLSTFTWEEHLSESMKVGARWEANQCWQVWLNSSEMEGLLNEIVPFIKSFLEGSKHTIR
jgi:hypothetical protein